MENTGVYLLMAAGWCFVVGVGVADAWRGGWPTLGSALFGPDSGWRGAVFVFLAGAGAWVAIWILAGVAASREGMVAMVAVGALAPPAAFHAWGRWRARVVAQRPPVTRVPAPHWVAARLALGVVGVAFLLTYGNALHDVRVATLALLMAAATVAEGLTARRRLVGEVGAEPGTDRERRGPSR